MKAEIKLTEDGSHTLFVPEIDESYHSTFGAIQESKHIFIETGLKHHSGSELCIFEVGFGTGLNAFLTYITAKELQIKVKYISVEKYPLSEELYMKLNYAELIHPDYKDFFNDLHKCSWNKLNVISDFFSIEKIETDFTQFEHKNNYDVIYFDAFSPEKQPEMWSEEQFRKIYEHSNQDAILTTYCAKGMVRRAMISAGFKVERLPGPPGKREILRATKQ